MGQARSSGGIPGRWRRPNYALESRGLVYRVNALRACLVYRNQMFPAGAMVYRPFQRTMLADH